MSEERCPVCGKAKEANTYSCSGCGFPLAFVTQFSDKESYDLWSEQVKEEKQKLTNKKTQKSLLTMLTGQRADAPHIFRSSCI